MHFDTRANLQNWKIWRRLISSPDGRPELSEAIIEVYIPLWIHVATKGIMLSISLPSQMGTIEHPGLESGSIAPGKAGRNPGLD